MEISRPASVQPLPSSAKRVFKGSIFDVYQWEQVGYDGSVKVFEKLKRSDTAFVLPVLEDGRILYSLQQQPGKAPYLGLIGGRVDEGETALEAGKRELHEEAGCIAETWSCFSAVQPYSKIDWCVYVFLAKKSRLVADQHLDGAEKIELRYSSFEEFIDLVVHRGLGDDRLRIRFLEALLNPLMMEELKRQFDPGT